MRIWERRYGFPSPVRDQHAERLYSQCQVEKLHLVKHLIDLGHRPGRISLLPLADLQALAGLAADADTQHQQQTPVVASAWIAQMMLLIKHQQLDQLAEALNRRHQPVGLQRFVVEFAAPLTRMVRAALARGELEVFEERFFTETLHDLLRASIASVSAPVEPPSILLATFSAESSVLDLLMAQAIMKTDGCRCRSLGGATPVMDIARAAASQSADVVVLSFSPSCQVKQLVDGIVNLRAELPSETRIWVGGSCTAVLRRLPDGVAAIDSLVALRSQLTIWRNDSLAADSLPGSKAA